MLFSLSSLIWWLNINISYGIINVLYKGNLSIYIYLICALSTMLFIFFYLFKKNSWISCKLNYLPQYERVNVLQPVEEEGDFWPSFFVRFLLDNWEDRGRVDKAKDFRWRWGIEQEKRTGDYSRNPSNRDSQLKHRQLESVWGRGDSRGWWL